MKDLLVNIVGYSAAIVGTCLMLPQVIVSYKTKKVGDLSFPMLILYFLNCSLWALYGYLINQMPVLLCNSIALLISIFQLYLKIKYQKDQISS